MSFCTLFFSPSARWCNAMFRSNCQYKPFCPKPFSVFVVRSRSSISFLLGDPMNDKQHPSKYDNAQHQGVNAETYPRLAA
jgi:hypothetical protein